jgi:hypothetical protein
VLVLCTTTACTGQQHHSLLYAKDGERGNKGLLMNSVWVVILVTAVSPFHYNVSPLIDADTQEQCHRKAVMIEQDIQREDNQEMICIQVKYE